MDRDRQGQRRRVSLNLHNHPSQVKICHMQGNVCGLCTLKFIWKFLPPVSRETLPTVNTVNGIASLVSPRNIFVFKDTQGPKEEG